SHRCGLEVRAFEDDRPRRRGDLRRRPAHHAGDRLRAVAVGDHQHVRLELPVDAIEGGDRLAELRAAYADLATGELRRVERVHRLPDLDVDVVGDVDDGADRANARGLQTIRDPCWRRAGSDLGDERRIPRAQFLVVYCDAETVGGVVRGNRG